MALITFMSDFGSTDHYIAAVKARVLSINPELPIIDISHQITPFDITHGSYVLRSVFREFPSGTIHIVAVNTIDNKSDKCILVKIEEHFFIGADNGLLSLISEKDPEVIIEIAGYDTEPSVFPARDIMARAAAMLAGGTEPAELGKRKDDFFRLLGRQLKATKKQISGNVSRVDHYGNLITNIEEEIFNILNKNRPFEIKFGREICTVIHGSYGAVDPGECFVLFNSSGFLEIGINNGNASELMGLIYDSPVIINFPEDS